MEIISQDNKPISDLVKKDKEQLPNWFNKKIEKKEEIKIKDGRTYKVIDEYTGMWTDTGEAVKR